MKKEAKKLLKKIIDTRGFVADCVQDPYPRLWYKNHTQHSAYIPIGTFDYLVKNGYLIKSIQNRYLVSQKGINFVTPWYRKIFK